MDETLHLDMAVSKALEMVNLGKKVIKIITNYTSVESFYNYDNKMLIYAKLSNCQYK